MGHYRRRVGYPERDYRGRIGTRRELGNRYIYSLRRSKNRRGEPQSARLRFVQQKIIAKKLAKDLHNNIIVIIFVVSTKDR